MSKLEEFRTRKLLRDIFVLTDKVNDAVKENFGSCPDYPWFNTILDKRDSLLQKLKVKEGDEKYFEIIDRLL